MALTADRVESKAAEYADREPLYAREAEHVEMLPAMFRSGEFGWRDTEWPVRWYFRRFLGEYPDRERRAIEEAYGDNDYESVRDALGEAADADDPAEAVRSLTALAGVDVRVASAFLLFLDPESYVVVGPRTWGVLHDEGVLDEPYPDAVSVEDYLAYLDACRDLAAEFDVSMWTLYRALWRIAVE